MAFIIIDKEACKGCGLCVKACPREVIAVSAESNKGGYFFAEPAKPEKCIGCTMCAVMCPDCCITVDK